MTTRSPGLCVGGTLLGTIGVAVLLISGLLWQECLLLAGAALAAQRASLWPWRRGPAREPWRLGLHCLLVGCAALIGTLVLGAACLMAVVTGALPAHAAPVATLLLIAGTAALTCGVPAQARQCLSEAALWLPLLLAASVALMATGPGHSMWACIASLAALPVLLGTSWQLARGGAATMGASQGSPG